MTRLGWPAATLIGALAGAVGALAPSHAAAEIYGWVDPSGDVTYSNLPPPKSARVFDVIQETPPPSPQAQAAAQAAQEAEMRVLNSRVQQLEHELQQARWQEPPAAPPYYPVAAPPSYGPPPSYAQAPSYGAGCDAEYFDCDAWQAPVYYTVGVVPYWGYRGHGHGGHDGSRRWTRPNPHTAGWPHNGSGAGHPAGHASSSGSMAHYR